MIIYHITRQELLPKVLAGSDYAGDTLLTEGFIHCSTASQVIDVANQRFKGQPGLVVLAIEADLVKPEVRYENLEGGTKLFPHIYGPLNRSAIQNIIDLVPGQDGLFTFPGDIA
jgi:uncharacterized protein (DUF952 family)